MYARLRCLTLIVDGLCQGTTASSERLAIVDIRYIKDMKDIDNASIDKKGILNAN